MYTLHKAQPRLYLPSMSTNNENTTGYLKLIKVFYDNVMIEIEMINKKSKKKTSVLWGQMRKNFTYTNSFQCFLSH